MSVAESGLRYTPEEYLRREYDAPEKHQFYHGEIWAMAGGTAEHSLIISNVNRELGNRLKGERCRVYDSNLRVRIPRTTLYTYPDVSVVCGEIDFDSLDKRRTTMLNPALVVEVLSPSTEAWDRGEKLQSYIQIDSLREYVLISSQLASVETFFRQSDGTWLYAPTTTPATAVKIRSLNIDLLFADIYAGVTFPPLVINVPVEREL
jgi:Uma2 family endonuclease